MIVPAEGLRLEVEPRVADQELTVGTRYWEGAVRVRGSRPGGQLAGQGYVELGGYAE
jgi:predicted secreted hydrolase